MSRQPSKYASLLTLIFALAVVTAWIQSHWASWSRTWSQPQSLTGNHVVSADGRFYWQYCHLTPTDFDSKSPQGPAKFAMPENFAVGSNAAGEPTIVPIAEYPVRFAAPAASNFVGVYGQARYERSEKNEFWRATVHEVVVHYWVLALITAVFVVSHAVRWIRWRWAKRDGGGESPLPTQPT